jgi:hypothetical protein
MKSCAAGEVGRRFSTSGFAGPASTAVGGRPALHGDAKMEATIATTTTGGTAAGIFGIGTTPIFLGHLILLCLSLRYVYIYYIIYGLTRATTITIAIYR